MTQGITSTSKVTPSQLPLKQHELAMKVTPNKIPLQQRSIAGKENTCLTHCASRELPLEGCMKKPVNTVYRLIAPKARVTPTKLPVPVRVKTANVSFSDSLCPTAKDSDHTYSGIQTQCPTAKHSDHTYSGIQTPSVSKRAPRRKLLLDSNSRDPKNNDSNGANSTNDHGYAKPSAKRSADILHLLKLDMPGPETINPELRYKIVKATNIQELTKVCMQDANWKTCIENAIVAHISSCIGSMSAKTHGPNVSVLSKTGYEELTTFSWIEVVEEFVKKHLLLAKILISACLPDIKNVDSFAEYSSRIGMIYSIIMQSRIHYLSRVQRVITHCLQESTCERKVCIYFYNYTKQSSCKS